MYWSNLSSLMGSSLSCGCFGSIVSAGCCPNNTLVSSTKSPMANGSQPVLLPVLDVGDNQHWLMPVLASALTVLASAGCVGCSQHWLMPALAVIASAGCVGFWQLWLP